MRVVKFLLIFLILFIITSSLALIYTYYSIPKIESTTSILVLGTGGEGHTAPDLTDTIMQVVLNPATSKISVLSLPRDIWIPEIRAKINTAYHYGQFKMAGDSVLSITGVPVNYTLLVDFSVFKDLINSIGGIDVDVVNSFTDQKYPVTGKENDLCDGDKTYACRYETLTFTKGMQTMDGELALKFVRSRNSTGDEGTDIAREKRQQKVVMALKEKILSGGVIFNPRVIKSLYTAFATNIKTDIDLKTAASFARYMVLTKANINYLSIPEEMLKISTNNIKYDKQYVFIPTSGTWKEFQEWISKSL